MENDNLVHLIGRLVPKPGKEAELAQAIKDITPDVLREPGCIAYIPHESQSSAGTIVMIETWASQEALNRHFTAPSFTRIAARFANILDGEVSIEKLKKI
ncbi:putative quinol monooxygenase [Methylobacterium radiotolerans]|uniref:putative quinol monooxygenase n=1 Tax=Methylobacterium radiotolerans TaxID=31998 RepID=UPI00097794BC|nr:putative quinol monooxygenase [Methylobacterium radiotolerans]